MKIVSIEIAIARIVASRFVHRWGKSSRELELEHSLGHVHSCCGPPLTAQLYQGMDLGLSSKEGHPWQVQEVHVLGRMQ
jgi:hypothetical protein